jgi:hypothetical protein
MGRAPPAYRSGTRQTGAMPQRIQLRRTKGWRKPDGAVVVSRPTKWGNPHRVRPDAPTEAIERYRADLLAGRLRVGVDEVQRELRGRDLACWCRAGRPCHADVLLEIANDG